jgi:integrase
LGQLILRHAEWTEIDLDGHDPQWRIPAQKMKMGEQHIVPLSKQAIALLGELRPLTGRGPYLFPSLRTRSRPMSNNTVNAALRRLGYTSEEMTGHGFRSLASTCLNEQDYHPDLIELQLAHAERNNVRAAYNTRMAIPREVHPRAAYPAPAASQMRARCAQPVRTRPCGESRRRWPRRASAALQVTS